MKFKIPVLLPLAMLLLRCADATESSGTADVAVSIDEVAVADLVESDVAPEPDVTPEPNVAVEPEDTSAPLDVPAEPDVAPLDIADDVQERVPDIVVIGCWIDDVLYDDGAAHPTEPCKQCDAAVSQFVLVADDTVCGGPGQRCCAGVCVDATTPDRCGACGTVCEAPAFPGGLADCVDEACTFECADGYIVTNAVVCGDSCDPCPTPPFPGGKAASVDGACGFTCNNGYKTCGNTWRIGSSIGFGSQTQQDVGAGRAAVAAVGWTWTTPQEYGWGTGGAVSTALASF